MRPYRRSVPITALPCLRKSGAQHASIARLAAREVILLQRHIEQPFQHFGLLRAGNGLLDGVLDLIPAARVGFVGLYRDEATLQPVQYYCKLPSALSERVVIALDPMLATGNSSAAAITLLKQSGARNIRFVCLLAAPEGVARMAEAHPDVPIYTAALDERLNEKGYILPGLGDAGDRMFGTTHS